MYLFFFLSDAKILTQTTLDMMQELGDCERCRKPPERSQRSIAYIFRKMKEHKHMPKTTRLPMFEYQSLVNRFPLGACNMILK